MKNSKLLIVLLSVLLVSLSGCSKGMESATKINEMKTRCIDGVKYIAFKELSGNQGFGFMTVKFKRDGSVETCG
tara:strand:+ start:2926 stop:3147 length:222 start_codon:yes stop_codon:yes gene_type:complete